SRMDVISRQSVVEIVNVGADPIQERSEQGIGLFRTAKHAGTRLAGVSPQRLQDDVHGLMAAAAQGATHITHQGATRLFANGARDIFETGVQDEVGDPACDVGQVNLLLWMLFKPY